MARLFFASLAALTFVQAASASELPATQRAAIIADIDKDAPQIGDAALKIWNYAEVGYQEAKSSALLQQQLKAAGFTIKAGVAGMPTAFVASYRTGPGPVIGILAEYDALPGLSQAEAATKQAVPGRDAGHGCGHNLFGAGSIGAAIAVRHWMQANAIKGEIRVYGSPAEEGGSGKVYLVRAGLFKDVDTVLHWHPADVNTAAQTSTMANISGKFRFHGISAHAAYAPEKGRSALDGVQVMTTAVEYLREHIPDATRIHYIITNGGKAPNVVPDFAELYIYVRQNDPAVVKDVWARVIKAAEGAAIATGTTQDSEIIGGVYSMLPNDALGRVMDANLRAVGGLNWSPEDTAFATKLAASLPGKPTDFSSVTKVGPYSSNGKSAGSSDVSDISWVTPTVGLGTATMVPGSVAHSWQWVAAAGNPIGVKGAVLAAKVLALTAADAFADPALIARAKTELKQAQGANFTYSAMVGDRQPPLDYRKQSGGE